MSGFVPELALAERFYREQVGPLLRSRFPSVAYSSALLGDGSGVLGFDTALSCDHDWGPRLQVFVAEESVPARWMSP